LPIFEGFSGAFAPGVVAVMMSPLIWAIIEVRRGHGADRFVNVDGWAVTWISVVIDFAVGGFALLIALLARTIYLWRVKRGL
jgi:hypothetical protein